MKRLLCCIGFASSVFWACGHDTKDDPDLTDRGDDPPIVRLWGRAGLDREAALTSLQPGDVRELCLDVAEHYYPRSVLRGRCTLEALAQGAQEPPAVDAGVDPACTEGDDAHTEDGGARPSEDSDDAAVPDPCNATDAGDDTGEPADADAEAALCEQRVEQCKADAREPAERLEAYCATRDRVPANCMANVADVAACAEAYEFEVEEAWRPVSCDNAQSREPAAPAFVEVFECKQLETACPGFLKDMLAPVLETP